MDRIKLKTSEAYAKWAATYDAYPNGLLVVEEPIVRKLAGDVRGLSVLDAACGTGRHSRWLHASGAVVRGIDESVDMLRVARENAPEIDFRAGTLTELSAEDASFDLVVCALALEHLEDVRPPLAELCRVLRRGKALLLSMFHPFFMLKGVQPHFEHELDDVEYEIAGHPHLISTVFGALRALGMTLTDLHEPLVDQALISRYPRFAKHLGHPLGVVYRAEKH